MQLTKFRVTKYRAILDSGWVDVCDITVIVGKNESGKTGLLKALHKFKPFKHERFDIEREWPRGHRKECSPDAVVVTTHFSFTQQERDVLATHGHSASQVSEVEVAKTYGGEYRFTYLPTDIFDTPTQDDVVKDFAAKSSNWHERASPELKRALADVASEVTKALTTSGLQSFDAHLTDWQNSIDQAVQADATQDPPVAAAAKTLLSRFPADWNSWAPKQNVNRLVESWIPTFIYMDDHKPFSGVAHLDHIQNRKQTNTTTDEDGTFLKILEMADLDFQTEFQRATQPDKEQRMLDMNDASLSLTNLIAKHWSQRKYRVRFEADGYHVIAFVCDEVQPALVPLNERSKGFQWFFSFDMTFMYETKGTFRGAVLLLDEPGLHLHAAAQRDLLLRMKEYAKENQLIYTTHMPFMLDMERLDNIRVCTENKDEGTKVSSDFYVADEHARFPLQAALGLSMSQSLFVGPFNLVVEGVTDFWFLSTISSILRETGRPSLDERIVITPSGGASKAAYVGTMLQGQHLNVVVLLDSDPEGNRVADGLIKKWIMKDRHVLNVGSAVARKTNTTIEDLFPLDFYLGFVNQAYSKALSAKPLTVAEVSAIKADLVVDRINTVLRARGVPANSDGVAFNKGRPAKLLLQALSGKGTADFPADTFPCFEQLFQSINAAMPTLDTATPSS
jgi:predicted ATPase